MEMSPEELQKSAVDKTELHRIVRRFLCHDRVSQMICDWPRIWGGFQSVGFIPLTGAHTDGAGEAYFFQDEGKWRLSCTARWICLRVA
jgi:hypothetical protein